MLQPCQGRSPGAAGRTWEQMIPRALGFLLRSTGRIVAAQNICQTRREKDLDKQDCCHQRMGVQEHSQAVWIQGWGSPCPAVPGTALPSMGSSWCCPMGNYPPEHSELGMPGPTRHKHSTQSTLFSLFFFLEPTYFHCS